MNINDETKDQNRYLYIYLELPIYIKQCQKFPILADLNNLSQPNQIQNVIDEFILPMFTSYIEKFEVYCPNLIFSETNGLCLNFKVLIDKVLISPSVSSQNLDHKISHYKIEHTKNELIKSIQNIGVCDCIQDDHEWLIRYDWKNAEFKKMVKIHQFMNIRILSQSTSSTTQVNIPDSNLLEYTSFLLGNFSGYLMSYTAWHKKILQKLNPLSDLLFIESYESDIILRT